MLNPYKSYVYNCPKTYQFGLHGMIINGMDKYARIPKIMYIVEGTILYFHQEFKEELILIWKTNLKIIRYLNYTF